MTSKALIAYDNILTRSTATITISGERTGFGGVNAWDWKTTTYWSPPSYGVFTITAVFGSAVTADYFAVYRHNLAVVSGLIRLQYSADSGSTWTDVFTDQTLTDNQLLLKTFTAITSTHWRVRVNVGSTATDYCYIGMLMIGAVFPLYRGMPAGFLPPHQGRRTVVTNSTTEGGQFAGRSIISRGAGTTIVNRSVPVAWVRQYWEPFQIHGERYPFLFSWNHTDRPGDACWCQSDGDFPPPGPIDENYRQTITLPVKCLLSGTV